MVPRKKAKAKTSNGRQSNKGRNKSNGKQAAAPEPKRYSLTREELAAYSMVSLRLDLAKEKMANAKQLQESTDLMRQQWIQQVFGRRAIPLTAKANIDVDTGSVTVLGAPAAEPGDAPPLAPEPEKAQAESAQA